MQVVKVKAHATRNDVLEGRVLAIDKAANDFADEQAKAAALRHPSSQAAEARCTRTWQSCTMVAKYLARVHVRAAELGHDTTARSQRLKPTRELLRVMRASRPTEHRLFLRDGRWRCTFCLRSAMTQQALRAAACRHGRLHTILVTGHLYFCARCGAYTRKRARLLLAQCRGRPPRGSHGSKVLAKLAAGRCPVTGDSVERPTPAAGLVMDLLLTASCDHRVGVWAAKIARQDDHALMASVSSGARLRFSQHPCALQWLAGPPVALRRKKKC